jgi:hypothetical protein
MPEALVTFLAPIGPYRAGQFASFLLPVAQFLVASGFAAYCDEPSEIGPDDPFGEAA